MNRKQIMLECGCQSNCIRTASKGQTHDPIPACAIHDCITPAKIEPDLTDRKARCCTDKSIRSSDDHERLAFFEFRGEGSKQATQSCKNCGYFEVAHKKPNTRSCGRFEAHGAYKFDSYYCGHSGWD